MTSLCPPLPNTLGCKETATEEDHMATKLGTGEWGPSLGTSPLWSWGALLARVNFLSPYPGVFAKSGAFPGLIPKKGSMLRRGNCPFVDPTKRPDRAFSGHLGRPRLSWPNGNRLRWTKIACLSPMFEHIYSSIVYRNTLLLLLYAGGKKKSRIFFFTPFLEYGF